MASFFPNSTQNLNINPLGDHVDVIMRTKDRPILLVRALASVLSQTHTNWHLYLVNDGGNKKKLETTIKGYLPAFGDKLTIINNDSSQGMEAASNAALRRSKGDYIIVHDDDDSWHPNFLLTCVEYLRNPENVRLSGVVTNCEVVREVIQNDRVAEVSREPWGFFRDTVTYKDLLMGNIAPPISFLIRKEVANKAGAFNQQLPVLGDWDYILRVMQIGDIGTINKRLAYYHHRIDCRANSSVYENSVIGGAARHNLYNALYSNASMRATLDKDPTLFGVFRYMAMLQTDTMDLQRKIDTRFVELMKEIKYCGVWGKICLEIKRWRRKYFKRN